LASSSRRKLAKRYCILYFADLRMHARVSQLHFFAYESKLRYVRDSPEGAVKYSRQSPHRAAHPPGTAAAKRRNPYYPRFTFVLLLPRRIYWYYARCQWSNPNNCVIENHQVRFPYMIPCRFVSKLLGVYKRFCGRFLSLSISVLLAGKSSHNARTSKWKYLCNPRHDVISSS